MGNTGVIPACKQDLATYDQSCDRRKQAYDAVVSTTSKLEATLTSVPEDTDKAACYFADVVKPAMEEVRTASDNAEGLVQASLWPFPTYQDMLFAHHGGSLKA
eukprot:NODE_14439_length_421_cov_21.292517_g14416_i0.p1 GENE.NODE_14439_length_421_cov_21.292517_g14416_i0~~NODE_14439_length_421_cov_21.292517_g14416_i0.p1  ORF type:complete len:110 (+),score=29.31 NODE_14439_length_421_cov_21.292517_g14416_i0:22-330(+)